MRFLKGGYGFGAHLLEGSLNKALCRRHGVNNSSFLFPPFPTSTNYTTKHVRVRRRDYSTASASSLLQSSGVKLIVMPKLSPTMESGSVGRWLHDVNHQYACYDIVVEVGVKDLVGDGYKNNEFEGELTMLIETQDDIVLVKKLIEEGAEVKCGTPIALAVDHGEWGSHDASAYSAIVESIQGLNTYDEDLGPDIVVSWQAFLKTEKCEADTAKGTRKGKGGGCCD